jgi:hypothetical protein
MFVAVSSFRRCRERRSTIRSLHQSLSARREPSSGKSAKWKIFKLHLRKSEYEIPGWHFLSGPLK